MKKIFSLVLLSAFSLGFSQKKWSLQECVDYAVKNNLQVISNQYNADIQAKNLEISKRDKLPSVSGSFNNNMSFGTTQGFQGSIGRNDNFNNSASVGANMQLYNNGRLKKSAEKSQYDLEASLLDAERVKNDISLQIAQQYLQVFSVHRLPLRSACPQAMPEPSVVRAQRLQALPARVQPQRQSCRGPCR